MLGKIGKHSTAAFEAHPWWRFLSKARKEDRPSALACSCGLRPLFLLGRVGVFWRMTRCGVVGCRSRFPDSADRTDLASGVCANCASQPRRPYALRSHASLPLSYRFDKISKILNSLLIASVLFGQLQSRTPLVSTHKVLAPARQFTLDQRVEIVRLEHTESHSQSQSVPIVHFS